MFFYGLVNNPENDFPVVYNAIRIMALRPFLNDGDNDFLDREIKEYSLFPKCSERAKALIFSRPNKTKKDDKEKED